MKNIGLLFGSFNPIHNGHLMMASYVLAHSYVDEVWFSPTPQNPSKDTISVSYKDRVNMIKNSVVNCSNIYVNELESQLEPPYYTCNSLIEFQNSYQECDFSIIIGEDIFNSFDKWKDYQTILHNFRLIVLSRSTNDRDISFKRSEWLSLSNIPLFLPFPKIDISSSFIRNEIMIGSYDNIKFFIPNEAYEYMKKYDLYEKKKGN